MFQVRLVPEESSFPKVSEVRLSLSKVSAIINTRTYRISTILIATFYLVIYSLITGILVISLNDAGVSLLIVENWPSLIFRTRTPFNWEPIGILSLGGVQIFLALPNMIFGLIVGILVGANISVSIYTYRARNVCKIDPTKSVAVAIPALLTGVACCGPTFLLSLGIASASVTIAFVSVLPFLFPIALAGLALSLIWSGWKLSQTTTASQNV